MDAPPISSITSLTIDETCSGQPNEDIKDLDLAKLENLKVLKIEDCHKLTTLPANAFITAPNLKELHLDENNLINISQDALKGLENLEFIDLKYNRALEELPFDFFRHAKNISKIDISNTKLRYDLFTIYGI